MTIRYSGLEVIPTDPASMRVIVQPGWLAYENRVIRVDKPCLLPIRPAGQRRYVRQAYQVRGEGVHSPCGWNGEDIRGSGGAPYQRMVPGSLTVFSKDRNTRYLPEVDYVQDSYWGTIKRHPQGSIADKEELSIDYSVWLCRYDAVVLSPDGSLTIVEGDSDALESRELLLPEPPVIREGFVLAHIITGWGQNRIHGGGSHVVPIDVNSPLETDAHLPTLNGRYEDMVERDYVIDVEVDPSSGQRFIASAATGEDYGTDRILTMSELRWTDRVALPNDYKLPLLLRSAYGHDVDWGLELDLSPIQFSERRTYTIRAIPDMIFDRRPSLTGLDPLAVIPMEQMQHLRGFRQLAAGGSAVRIAFYGESTSRAGRWPYQVMRQLRESYPGTKFYSSNVAVGGESSPSGIRRLENEALSVRPDLLVLEYLINDACTGDLEAIEQTLRAILVRLAREGVPCLIVTNNGMNPLFSVYGSSRNFRSFHELYRRLAAEYDVAFIGGYAYFTQLHKFGKYFLTELKGNMVNHPFGNQDPHWCPFDDVVGQAIIHCLREGYNE